MGEYRDICNAEYRDYCNAGAPELKAITPVASIRNLAAVVEFIARANKKLKRPSILIAGNIKLSVAGPNARVPGSINITDPNKSVDFRPVWYGRILADGTYEPSAGAGEDANDIADMINKFAADPANGAAAYGKLTGKCCFCAQELTDPASTEVGYGKICASKYGLPWGV
jgi:hypothetical protein